MLSLGQQVNVHLLYVFVCVVQRKCAVLSLGQQVNVHVLYVCVCVCRTQEMRSAVTRPASECTCTVCMCVCVCGTEEMRSAVTRPASQCTCTVSVSYTHLTLPTIYSV